MENNTENIINQTISLEEQLSRLQDKWTDIIKELNDKMKTISSLDNLMNEVYTKRQEAIDVYYGTLKILATRTRDYKIKSAKEELRKHPDAFRRPLDTFSNNERITIDKS